VLLAQVHVWCGVVAFSARAVRSPPNVKTPASRSVLLLLWLRPFFCSEASNPAVGWQGTCQWVDDEVVWAGRRHTGGALVLHLQYGASLLACPRVLLAVF